MSPQFLRLVLDLQQNTLPQSVLFRGEKIFTKDRETILIKDIREDHIKADVHSSSSDAIYQVEIGVDTSKKSVRAKSTCTCPFNGDYRGTRGCKHSLALTLLASELALNDQLAPTKEDWRFTLNRVRALLQETPGDLEITLGTQVTGLVLVVQGTPTFESLRCSPARVIQIDPPRLKRLTLTSLKKKRWTPDDQVLADRIISQFYRQVESLYMYHPGSQKDFEVPGAWLDGFLEELVEQEKLWVTPPDEEPSPLKNALHPACSLQLCGEKTATSFSLKLQVTQGEQHLQLDGREVLFSNGLMVKDQSLYRIEPRSQVPWLAGGESMALMDIPLAEAEAAVRQIVSSGVDIPPLDFPEELHYESVRAPLVPELAYS